jgi:hypothetical protein
MKPLELPIPKGNLNPTPNLVCYFIPFFLFAHLPSLGNAQRRDY